MGDPILCCVLGICCPPGSAEQFAAFEDALTEQFKGDRSKAIKVAEKMRDDLVKFSEKMAKACEDGQ